MCGAFTPGCNAVRLIVFVISVLSLLEHCIMLVASQSILENIDGILHINGDPFYNSSAAVTALNKSVTTMQTTLDTLTNEVNLMGPSLEAISSELDSSASLLAATLDDYTALTPFAAVAGKNFVTNRVYSSTPTADATNALAFIITAHDGISVNNGELITTYDVSSTGPDATITSVSVSGSVRRTIDDSGSYDTMRFGTGGYGNIEVAFDNTAGYGPFTCVWVWNIVDDNLYGNEMLVYEITNALGYYKYLKLYSKSQFNLWSYSSQMGFTKADGDIFAPSFFSKGKQVWSVSCADPGTACNVEINGDPAGAYGITISQQYASGSMYSYLLSDGITASIGGNSPHGPTMDMYEFQHYTRALSDLETDDLAYELMTKWNISSII